MQAGPASLHVAAVAASDWWYDWVDQLVLNLALAFSWLTVVLGPPATMGLYYVNHHLAHGESLGFSGLVEGGRRYFWIGWLWGLINLLVGAILIANFFFYNGFTAAWSDLIKWFFFILALLWLLVQFYALPYLMEQEKKNLFLAMRNGLFTILAAPGFSLVLGVIALLILLLSTVTLAPLVLGGPCFIVLLGCHAVRERLEAFKVRDRPV